jgi:hypothetical protein
MLQRRYESVHRGRHRTVVSKLFFRQPLFFFHPSFFQFTDLVRPRVHARRKELAQEVALFLGNGIFSHLSSPRQFKGQNSRVKWELTVSAVQLHTVASSLVELLSCVSETLDEIVDLSDRQRARLAEGHSHQWSDLASYVSRKGLKGIKNTVLTS